MSSNTQQTTIVDCISYIKSVLYDHSVNNVSSTDTLEIVCKNLLKKLTPLQDNNSITVEPVVDTTVKIFNKKNDHYKKSGGYESHKGTYNKSKNEPAIDDLFIDDSQTQTQIQTQTKSNFKSNKPYNKNYQKDKDAKDKDTNSDSPSENAVDNPSSEKPNKQLTRYCHYCYKFFKNNRHSMETLLCKTKDPSNEKCIVRYKPFGENISNKINILFYRTSVDSIFNELNARNNFSLSTKILKYTFNCIGYLFNQFGNDDKYLLCGGHFQENGPIDTQFGITGKLKNLELSINGIRREVKEELHHKISDTAIVQQLNIHNEETDPYTYFMIDLDNCNTEQFKSVDNKTIKTINSKIEAEEKKGSNDDWKNKIAVFIVGSKQALQTHFTKFSSSELLAYDFIKISNLKTIFKPHLEHS